MSNFSFSEEYYSQPAASVVVGSSGVAESVVGGSSGAVSQIASDLLSAYGGQAAAIGSSNSYALSAAGMTASSASIQSSLRNSLTGATTYLSEVEQAILRSTVPININEIEEITVLGQRGIWANKNEVVNWKGVYPLNQYVINEDDNPEIITKRSQETLTYIQELAIRYLRPPTPPPPGEILIVQEENTLTPPAPPVVIRQQPARPSTPEPLVLREAPPQPPPQVGRKVVTISGKRLPPPPRKVIIERLAPLPSKPQSVIVERWLPYQQAKRRVIFQKSNQPDPFVVKPRNVIVQWEAPKVEIKQEIKYLGTIRANPAEYVERYGASLKSAQEMPDFVNEIKAPSGVVLAANYTYSRVHELEGDLEALKLIDLEREGLGEYRSQLNRLMTSSSSSGQSLLSGALSHSRAMSSASAYDVTGAVGGSYASSSTSIASNSQRSLSSLLNEIFASVDTDGSGRISIGEAERLLLKLNSRLGRSYGENEVQEFFRALDKNGDGVLSIKEFRSAFEGLL